MKRVNEIFGRMMRLTSIVAILAATQQAYAVGTPAGDTISNTASVEYSVGNVPQGAITSAPAVFVVDRLVNFTLTPEDGSSTTVTPGGQGIASFLLTNIGNAAQDFQLSADNLVGVSINGVGDAFDMDTPMQIYADINDDGLLDAGDTPYVDGLSADATGGLNQIRLLVVADAPVGPTNGQGATIELTVVAAEGVDASNPGTPMTDDSGVADDATLEQVVIANGTLTGQDGYVISSAAIAVSKDSEVIRDPFSSSNPKAIPGAVIEYSITADNTGAEDATGIGFRDEIDTSLVTLALGEYGAGDAIIEQGGSTVFTCTLDEDDLTDGDGCGIFNVATTPEVRILPPVASSVTLDGTLTPGQSAATARFRVTIN